MLFFMLCRFAIQIIKDEKSWRNNFVYKAEESKKEDEEEQDKLETLSLEEYKDADLRHRLPENLLKYNR